MKTSALFRATFCSFALLASAFTASAQELVANGGFESGDFTGWTLTEPGTPISFVGSNPNTAHSGNGKAYLGSLTPAGGSIIQTLSTAPGELYNLSFWLRSDSDTPPNSFDVFWGGASVLSLTDEPLSSNYTKYSFTLLATGSSTTLDFQYRNDDDFFRLDDVSVSVVPEASTASLVLLGLGLIGFAAYRKTKINRSIASV